MVMKRSVSFIMLAASVAMLAGVVSCKKADEIKPEENLPTKFQDDSFVDVELSTDDAEYTGSISIKNENGKAVTYTLDIMSQQDLDDYYNSPYDADYKADDYLHDERNFVENFSKRVAGTYRL